MKKTTLLGLVLCGLLFTAGCKDDEAPALGDAPTAEDAAFTYKPSAANPNTIEFTASNSSLTAKWDFGNGSTGEGTNVTSSYPNKGTYTVTLTVFNSGGSASSSQDIVIAQDDLDLLKNPLYTLLTGGVNGPGSKTWVVDSTRVGHFGVGPNPSSGFGDSSEYWTAPRLAKSSSGLYSDRYVFKISGFGFDHITNGLVFINDDQASDFPGSYPNADDHSAPFADQMGETWTINEGADTTLTVSGKSFLGFFSGVRTYKIIRFTENALYLRYEDSKDPALAWYIRLVPIDLPPNDGGSNLDKPTVAASNPTTPASDVISMFCNVYTDVTVDTWRTGWSSGNLNEIQINGNDVKEYTDLNFVGIETVGPNLIDASGMTHINFDIWSPNSTKIKFKLVDFGADEGYQGGDDSEHEIEIDAPDQKKWVTVKIPLSDFTNLTSREHIAQTILVSEPSGTSVVYLDNVYFSK